MKCKQASQLIWPYVERSLPDSLRQGVEEHIESCQECSRLMQVLMSTEEILAEQRKVTANPFLATRILEKLGKKPVPHYSFTYPQLLRNIALISLAVVAGVLLGIRVMNNSMNTGNTMLSDQYSTSDTVSEFYYGDIYENELLAYLESNN
jgi:hypothetical protein